MAHAQSEANWLGFAPIQKVEKRAFAGQWLVVFLCGPVLSCLVCTVYTLAARCRAPDAAEDGALQHEVQMLKRTNHASGGNVSEESGE